MADYTRIMLAVDLTEESNAVAERAVALAQSFSAALHVVHVIEPLSLASGGDFGCTLCSPSQEVQAHPCRMVLWPRQSARTRAPRVAWMRSRAHYQG